MYYFVWEQDMKEIQDKIPKEDECIVLFKVELFSKTDSKEALNELKKKREVYTHYKKALQIRILSQFNGLASIINSLRKDFDLIIGYGGLNKVNRFFLEQCQVDYLQDPHNTRYSPRVDFIHHFNSGLNQVLCSFAQEKETGILIEITELSSKNWFKSKEFGRINQNISFARKYKLPLLITFNFGSEYDFRKNEEIKVIAQALGADSKQIKEMEFKLKEKLKKKEAKFIMKGMSYE